VGLQTGKGTLKLKKDEGVKNLPFPNLGQGRRRSNGVMPSVKKCNKEDLGVGEPLDWVRTQEGETQKNLCRSGWEVSQVEEKTQKD